MCMDVCAFTYLLKFFGALGYSTKEAQDSSILLIKPKIILIE